MNWFKRLTKLAFPYKQIHCLKCDNDFLVDLGEPIQEKSTIKLNPNWTSYDSFKEYNSDTEQNEEIEEQRGEKLTLCPTCGQKYSIVYKYSPSDMDTEIIDLEPLNNKTFTMYQQVGIENVKSSLVASANRNKLIFAQKNKVLAHIAGASGSGKTTLLNSLSKQYPEISFKDLDEFDDEATRLLGFKQKKNDYTNKMLKTLADKRQELMDKYVKESIKPIVFGGHHTEGDNVLKIPTNNKWMLNVDAKTSAERAYNRSQKEDQKFRRLKSELPQDVKEAQEVIDFLKENGYKKMSPEEIKSELKQLQNNKFAQNKYKDEIPDWMIEQEGKLKPNYWDIGHYQKVEDKPKLKNVTLWNYDEKRGLELLPAFTDKENSHMSWGSQTKRSYSGRYDANTSKLTIDKPFYAVFENVPKWIISELELKFSPKEIWTFPDRKRIK